MSSVYLLRYSKNPNVFEGLRGFVNLLSEVISKGDRVAVKLHMGELGNPHYLRPALVRRVVDLVKELGGKPFVTDTTTLYPLGRFTEKGYLETAAYNGFTRETVNAPVVIADGAGYEAVLERPARTVMGCQLREVEVAGAVAEADCMVVLTHFKGHLLTGFGGALKNVGMGCVTKKSKSDQHVVNRPILDESLCTGCGKCVQSCVYGALKMKGGKPTMDLEKCVSCNMCRITCPNEAWKLPEGSKEKLQVYVAHAASAVSRALEGRVVYVNFIQDVTALCDCRPSGSPRVVEDVGVAASLDPVAVDKASMDLVDSSELLGEFRRFKGRRDVLGSIHGVDGTVQLRAAERVGLGVMKYEVVEVSFP